MKLSLVIISVFLCNIALAMDEVQTAETLPYEESAISAYIRGGVVDCFVRFNCEGKAFARKVSTDYCVNTTGARSFYHHKQGQCYNL